MWCRFRCAAAVTAQPGWTSARGWASPSRVRGDTIVASRASWDPCQRGRPFATTSMRRASAIGTSTFMSARRTLRATLAPASWQTRATACSSQENTKQGAGYGNVIPRGCDIKGTGGERPSLGQQQRSRSRCKVRKVHLVRALVASMGSESLPALERPTVAGYCGVVGTGCGARRPLRGVKATVTQVLPREDRSSGTRQDALAAQRAEEALCSGGRAGLDDREGVAPRRQVSCAAVGAGTAQAQPTEPLGELGCPDSAGGEGACELEQVGEALRDGRVMGCCVGSCQVRGQYDVHVVEEGEHSLTIAKLTLQVAERVMLR